MSPCRSNPRDWTALDVTSACRRDLDLDLDLYKFISVNQSMPCVISESEVGLL